VVDNDQLAALSGASPARYGQLGWAVGSMLAALAGILLAPLVTLDAQTLTLLVVDGYAAAMLGRLRNLPLTFAGGLLIGLGVSYAVGYLPGGNILSDVEPAVPVALLFIFLLAMPQRSRRTPRLAPSALRVPRVPGLRESLIVAAVFVAVVFVVSGRLSAASLLTVGHGFAYAIIALSLVPLIGYSGQPSLCQLTFAGLGAYAMGQVAGGGSLLGLLAAAGLAAAAGAVIALPALRLQGLYLALATLAFAELMDTEFFGNTNVLGLNLAIFIGRVNLPGISLQSGQAYLVMLAVVFAAAAVGILALRRSVFGRRLAAMGDSAQNAASVGVSTNWARLAIFAGSAGLAGLGGALYGGQQAAVGPDDFSFLASLVLVLLVYLGGVRSVTGVFVASMIFAVFPLIQSHITALSNIAFLFTGLAAISLGRNPNGMIGNASPVEQWREHRARKRSPELPDASLQREEQHVSPAL
jgi:branched-chain amino acid transport system permease protein